MVVASGPVRGVWHSAVPPSRAGSPQPDSDPLYTCKDVGQEEEQYPNVHSYELEGLAHPVDPYHLLLGCWILHANRADPPVSRFLVLFVSPAG